MHACYHRELSILISSRLLHNNSWTTQNLRCKPGFCLYKWGNLHFFSFIRSHLLKEQKGGLLRVYVHSRDSGSDLTPILLDLSKSGPKSVPVVLDVSLYTLIFFSLGMFKINPCFGVNWEEYNLPGRGLMVWKKLVDLIMSSAQC